jgi:hypothetical protein
MDSQHNAYEQSEASEISKCLRIRIVPHGTVIIRNTHSEHSR